MGTRADFYVGRGETAEWLGSIAWDGYPSGIDDEVFDASDEAAYRAAVTAFFAPRDDVTMPDQGWPWPWDNSHTTDYAYTFSEGKVLVSAFGRSWVSRDEAQTEAYDRAPKNADVPDMSARKSVTLGPRSGLIVISA